MTWQKQLSHYLYFLFFFFSFYLGLTTQKEVQESVMSQSYHMMSHNESHDRHGKIVHRLCSSCISSVENPTRTLSSSLCQSLNKEQLALFWLGVQLPYNALFLQQSMQLQIVLSIRSLCSLPTMVCIIVSNIVRQVAVLPSYNSKATVSLQIVRQVALLPFFTGNLHYCKSGRFALFLQQ